MAAVSETIRYEVDNPPEGDEVLASFGVYYKNLTPDSNIFTVIEKNRQNEELTRDILLFIPDEETGDELWLYPEKPIGLQVADRIRFTKDHHIEFSHHNGTIDALVAWYDEDRGILDRDALILQAGVETTVPAQISPSAIHDIRETMEKLRVPKHNAFSLSDLQLLVQSPKLLGVFSSGDSVNTNNNS